MQVSNSIPYLGFIEEVLIMSDYLTLHHNLLAPSYHHEGSQQYINGPLNVSVRWMLFAWIKDPYVHLNVLRLM